MKMCMRCGHRGATKRWRIEINNGPTQSNEAMIDQSFQLCPDCTLSVLDQLSVVISNETWQGGDDVE